MSLYTFAEVFHGCKESADFFIAFVKKSANSFKKVYVILENLTPRDAKIIQDLRKNHLFHIETFRDHLVDKSGLLLGYILRRIYKIKNVEILGIDDNSSDRYENMLENILNHLKDGKHMLYYGFHLGYKTTGPQKNIVDPNLKKKYDIQAFGMFSYDIHTLLLEMDKSEPWDVEKKFQLENEFFSQHDETYYIKDINSYIPPTQLEIQNKNRNKISIIQSHEHDLFRQAGIWFSVYLHDPIGSILDYYCSTEVYDKMIYLPRASYLL